MPSQIHIAGESSFLSKLFADPQLWNSGTDGVTTAFPTSSNTRRVKITSFTSSCTYSSPDKFCSSLFSKDATFSCKCVMSFSFSWVSAVTCRGKPIADYTVSPLLSFLSPLGPSRNSVLNCILEKHCKGDTDDARLKHCNTQIQYGKKQALFLIQATDKSGKKLNHDLLGRGRRASPTWEAPSLLT